MKENAKLALIETSHRAGWVALALGGQLLAARPLQEARRHARDLAPLLQQLLTEQGWTARQLHGVIVSRGPGSYTGLRVGLMSAKTLAYAVGCPLLAVDTFAAVAEQAPKEIAIVDVIADAQQGRIYVQRFQRGPTELAAVNELRIVACVDWLGGLPEGVCVTGPGLEVFSARLPQDRLVAQQDWLPRPESLLRLGLQRWQRGQTDDPFAVEPLYLRPSSAEEKFMQVTTLACASG